jgi:hypothetical protein
MKKFTSKYIITSLLIGSGMFSAHGQLVGPVYPPPNGNTYSSSGNMETLTGATWSYGIDSPALYSALYWAPTEYAAGLDGGSPANMTLQSISGNVVTWTGTTTYEDSPGSVPTGTYDTRLIVTALSGLGANPWVTGASVGQSGVPALLNVTGASAYSFNVSFSVLYDGSYVGLSTWENTSRDTVASFGGGFYYAPVPEPSTVLAGAMLLLPFGSGAFRQTRKKFQAA